MNTSEYVVVRCRIYLLIIFRILEMAVSYLVQRGFRSQFSVIDFTLSAQSAQNKRKCMSVSVF
jgi:hypothetical protein